jgi:hypothetical protein
MGLTDGTGNALPWNSFVQADKFTILLSFYAESITGTSGTVYSNDAIICDNNAFIGIFLKDVGGGNYVIQSFNWPGSSTSSDISVTVGASHVVMMRHESGVLYISLDGGSESSVSSGNTSNISNFQVLLGKGDGTSQPFDGRIGEVAIYSEPLTGADLTNAIDYFVTKWITGALGIPTGTVGVTGLAPVLATAIRIDAGSVGVTGLAPSADVPGIIPIDAGSLDLTGYAPEVISPLIPDPGSVNLTGLAPAIDIGTGVIQVTQLPVEVLSDGSSGDIRVTQLPVEILHTSTGRLQITQLPIEVLHTGTGGDARVTQLAVEVVSYGIVPFVLTPPAGQINFTGYPPFPSYPGIVGVTQAGIESADHEVSTNYVSQAGIEAADHGDPSTLVSQMGIEVAMRGASPVFRERCQQIGPLAWVHFPRRIPPT